jgi:hypothetical protein
MQKSWYMLSECKQSDEYSDEYNEKMEFYEKICAHKKPYFFGYNYSSLMKEYKETVNRAKTNARQKFRMELADIFDAYRVNKDIPLDQKIFIEKFLRNLKLDNSKSTCNMICWEIEKIFDGVPSFATKTIDLYDIVRSNQECNPSLLDKITKTCKASEKKRAVKCVIEFLLNEKTSEDDVEYYNVDFDISDTLATICSNEEDLCDLLLDYCYKYNGNKEILWSVCGETIIKRLMMNNELYYPIVNPDGDFEVQGKKYSMKQYCVGGEDNEI